MIYYYMFTMTYDGCHLTASCAVASGPGAVLGGRRAGRRVRMR